MDPENVEPGKTPPATELGEVEDLKKKVTEGEVKFEDQRKRAEIAEAGLKEKTDIVDNLQKTITPEDKTGTAATPSTEEKPVVTDPRVGEIEETLRLKDKGYSTVEVEQLRSYAKGKGKTATDVLEDPDDNFATSIIETMRAKSKADQTTPPPTPRTPGAPEPTVVGTPNVATLDDVKFDEKGNIIRTKPPTFEEYQAKKREGGSAE